MITDQKLGISDKAEQFTALTDAVDGSKMTEYCGDTIAVPDESRTATVYQDQSAWPKDGDRVLKVRLDILNGKEWVQFAGWNCVAAMPFDLDGNPMLLGESHVDLPPGKARQIRVRVIPFVDLMTAVKVAVN